MFHVIHFSVICSEWHIMMTAPNCLDIALTSNNWATYGDLDGLAESDRKNIITQALRDKLDGEEHTLVDLMFRDISSEYGSLCGMALMYKALYDTILTDSQLTAYTYDKMKFALAQEIKMPETEAKAAPDVHILKSFYDFICAKNKPGAGSGILGITLQGPGSTTSLLGGSELTVPGGSATTTLAGSGTTSQTPETKDSSNECNNWSTILNRCLDDLDSAVKDFLGSPSRKKREILDEKEQRKSDHVISTTNPVTENTKCSFHVSSRY